jgi:hypothetical protein
MKSADPAAVVAHLRQDMTDRTDGRLGPGAVEAMDILNHALVYSNKPDGWTIWSHALRTGVVTKKAESAVIAMVEGLNEAVEAGDDWQVLQICDCLGAIFDASDTEPR